MCGIYNIVYRRYFAVPFVSDAKRQEFLDDVKKLQIIFKVLILVLISISISKAELLKPNNQIKPDEVVKIQLSGLQKNDSNFKDSGIEQTWNFAHPNNKKVTGPLPNFKRMLKGGLLPNDD
jgi:hypothetical protein